MKRQRKMSIAIIPAAFLIAGVSLAAQDKYTLQSPSGIAFSEFRGYEAWQTVNVSQPDDQGGCGTSPAPGCTKSILGNTVAIQMYADGIPDNGQPVPDGAAFAKLEWQKGRNSGVPYPATIPGPYAEVSFMLKDSKRFPKTHGWGYATFQYDAATETFKAKGDNPEFVNACHACHTIVKARDYLYTEYAQR